MDDDAQNLISGDGFELYATDALRISAQVYNTLILGESGSVALGVKADSVNGLRWTADMGAMCEGTAFVLDLVKDIMRVHNYGRFVNLNGNEINIIVMEAERINNSIASINTDVTAASDALQSAALKTSVTRMRQSLQSSRDTVENSRIVVATTREELAGACNAADTALEKLNATYESNAGTVSEVARQSSRAATVCTATCVNTVKTAATRNETAGSRIQK